MTKAAVASIERVTHRYGKTFALNDVTLDIPAQCMVGLIGPDGVGKSTLLALISGVRKIQTGKVMVLDGNMADESHRRASYGRIAYMPQGLGRNLYPTLSVFDNIDFFGRLFGQGAAERHARIDELLKATGLDPFGSRPCGKLSGGMKQKVSLCCSLMHDPDLLVLDEPTTGVDPLSRRQFWELIDSIRARRPSMSVLVATAYMDEASRFDWLAAMDDGKVIAHGAPKEILARAQKTTLDDAFIALLPPEKRGQHQEVIVRPRVEAEDKTPAIEADGPDVPVRRFRGCRSCQFSHRAGRDLWLPRFERLRKNHDHENDDRATAGHRRLGQIIRQADGRRRHGGASKRRLHVAGVFPLQRADGTAESRVACRSSIICRRMRSKAGSKSCSSGMI